MNPPPYRNATQIERHRRHAVRVLACGMLGFALTFAALQMVFAPHPVRTLIGIVIGIVIGYGISTLLHVSEDC